MTKKAVVIANGEKEGDLNFFKKLIHKADTFVCADGGAALAHQWGLVPDRIFGDLDSLNPKIVESFKMKGVQFLRFPVMKDKTDTHLVIDTLIEEGFSQIMLTAALGGRPDHLLGNLNLLSYGFDQNVDMHLLSPTVWVQVIQGEKMIDNHQGDTFSLLPITQEVRGVTLEGCKYPLNDATIQRESTLGISNQIIGEKARIVVKEGKAYLFIIDASIV